ncbi:MAG TPA: YbdD/YjiX family protein [Gemmatimonadaceae bacterium]|nr:YbdD/YjiX family protein [Gemmatimonadaceae bacterium]
MRSFPELLASRLESAARIVRGVVGAPDYEAYLQHMARCHPDAPPLSRKEFEEDRLRARYAQPGHRCC